MVLTILQWNARSLISNGQEFKKYVEDLEVKPDIICIQESWLIPRLDFVIKGYISVRRDRDSGKGGGVITFIQRGLQYKEVRKGDDLEYVTVEVWSREGKILIINFYNPCRQLEMQQLGGIWKDMSGKIIWCGDFNAHNTLWGDKNDGNGEVLEEFMGEEGLICLNDGSTTRVDISRGTESAIDLTIVSRNVADRCEWEVLAGNMIGSDHFPILVQVGVEVHKDSAIRGGRWLLEKADWEKFTDLSDEWLSLVDDSMSVEGLCREVSTSILAAAGEAIPKSESRPLSRIVPWWSKECQDAVKDRNSIFRQLKRSHNFQCMMEYKRAQALVRRAVRKAKKEYWRKFCDSVGRTTPIERIWAQWHNKENEGDRQKS